MQYANASLGDSWDAIYPSAEQLGVPLNSPAITGVQPSSMPTWGYIAIGIGALAVIMLASRGK